MNLSRSSLTLAVTAMALATPALSQNTSSLTHSVVLDGLENPWDMAFLDDGTMLFTEKCKGLSVRMPDGRKLIVSADAGPRSADGYRALLFELGTDPSERNSLARVDPASRNELVGALRDWREANRALRPETRRAHPRIH